LQPLRPSGALDLSLHHGGVCLNWIRCLDIWLTELSQRASDNHVTRTPGPAIAKRVRFFLIRDMIRKIRFFLSPQIMCLSAMFWK
jgi:hypothetical protein